MKKKGFLLVLMALVLTSLLLCSCGEGQDREISYEEAINVLEKTGVNEDGTYQVTKELLVALQNTEYTQPKNFIFMIGDGMGYHIVEAAQTVYADQLYEETLAMNHMPIQSSQTTYSVSDQTTDSAAGATAFATGYKTANKVISMDSEGENAYKTILELAAEKGKSTGIIATESITEATPAAFVAHVGNRASESDIAAMQLKKFVDGSLDLALGGGSSYYEMLMNEELLTQAQSNGMTYTTEWEKAESSSLPLAGLFAKDDMNTIKDEGPTLAEMTELALNQLGKDENGFFLMVEGSQIDNYAEFNAFDATVKNLYDFDCAIAVAMRYVALNPDTVLIITADHETGGVTLPDNPTKDNLDNAVFTTREHTCETVPVYAAGFGTDDLSGINENVDLGIFVASLMGEEQFGLHSTIHVVLEEETDISFDATNKEYVVSRDDMSDILTDIQHARALHVSVKNIGNGQALLPKLKFLLDSKEYFVEPQIDRIQAGDTVILSYVFPIEVWASDALKTISEFVFTVDGVEEKLQFDSLCITERILDK